MFPIISQYDFVEKKNNKRKSGMRCGRNNTIPIKSVVKTNVHNKPEKYAKTQKSNVEYYKNTCGLSPRSVKYRLITSAGRATIKN